MYSFICLFIDPNCPFIHPSTQPFILCMDLTSIYYFRHMMEEQECLQWSYHEKKISAIQLERMELLEKLLQQRETCYQVLNDKRLEHLW